MEHRVQETDAKMSKKLYLVSLGCPKNLVDSEVMLALLEKAGYCVCQGPAEADLMLVNTCGFIQSAVEEGIDEIIGLAAYKARDPGKRLVVTGCMVQRYGQELAKEFPEVDLFVGTEGFQDIVGILEKMTPGSNPGPFLAKPLFLMDSHSPRKISTPSHRAYLKVTEGCANRCSYCLIPSLRGPLRSRPVDDIIREAQRLEDGGVKELTLVAQDLTAYGIGRGQSSPLLDRLLLSLLKETAIPWLRLLYLQPARLDDSLLRIMADNPRLLPYLDIPLQHVSTRMLKLMNRPYDTAFIEAMLSRIRTIVPEVAIRTTLMVGFPSETEDDMRLLEEFIRTYRFEHVGVFPYSNEDGCAASNLPDQCPEGVKIERRHRLMELQAGISLENHKGMLGKTEEVLVEGVSRETDLLLEGRTARQAPEIDGCVYIASGECNAGDIVEVRFTEAHTYDLVGEIV